MDLLSPSVLCFSFIFIMYLYDHILNYDFFGLELTLFWGRWGGVDKLTNSNSKCFFLCMDNNKNGSSTSNSSISKHILEHL